ncbi:nitric oxide synthase oxygenase [Rhodococcus koreensis]|uniref:nitric oxide synthase oxygenase n=1 Tax=Rhodococcus koreensis TaxID=99653 RepID=UPI0036701677
MPSPPCRTWTSNIGGVIYPCSPLSGWYVSTEVGARNFSGENRYNMLLDIAARLNIDTSSDRTPWKDRALVELNRAVIHSYRQAGVIMVDHHTCGDTRDRRTVTGGGSKA